MRKHLAPSFVVVSALVACSKPQSEAAQPVPKEVESAKAKASEEPSPSATVAKATRKRKRSSDAQPAYKPASGAIPWEDLVPQNPRDADGRTIFVDGAVGCFVEVPPKSPPPKMLPPGVRHVETQTVDCPPELDDPAWDECAYGTLEASKTGSDCYCMHPGGNPPPPPGLVSCPKHKK